MKKLIIFDPAMCCSTGICGPGVDPELLRMSAVINKLKNNGLSVERYNPNSNPEAFINKTISNLINEEGIEILPVTIVDDVVMKKGSYPSNEELCEMLKLPKVFFKDLSGNKKSSCCCDGGCC